MLRITAATLLQVLTGLILIISLPPILGLQAFGHYAAIVSAATLSLAAFNFGSSSRFLYGVAQQKHESLSVRNTILRVKIFIHLPLTLAVCLAYAFTWMDSENIQLIVASVVFVFCQNTQQMLVGEDISRQRYNKIIQKELLFRLPLIAVALSAWVLNSKQVVSYLGFVSLLLVTTMMFRGKISIFGPISLGSFINYAKGSHSFFINSVTELLFWRLGVLIMPFVATLEEAGRLQINISVLMALGIIPLSIAKFFYPRFVADEVSKLRNLGFSTVLVFIFCLFAGPFLHHLISNYSETYFLFLTAVSGNVRQIITLTFLVGVSRLFRNYSAVNSNLKHYNRIYLSSGFSILLGALLYPFTISVTSVLYCMIFLELFVILLWILNYYKKEISSRSSSCGI